MSPNLGYNVHTILEGGVFQVSWIESNQEVGRHPKTKKLAKFINIIIPREGEHTIGTEAVDWAQKNWGRVIPKGEADAIVALCEEFSASGSEDPDTVVIEGLKYCLDADVRNVSYLRGILTDWREAGILSVDQVKAHEAEHVSQKKRKKHKALVGKPSLTPTNKYDSFYVTGSP